VNGPDDPDGPDEGKPAEHVPNGRRRRHRRVVSPGVEEPAADERAWEDDDRAWGEAAENREDALRRDVPPHWG
jgi:hypothetical protein